MGKPFTIQIEDEIAIEQLKEAIGAKTKIDVVREGLRLLEEKVLRQSRVQRWKKAAKRVAVTSRSINKEFQKSARIKKLK